MSQTRPSPIIQTESGTLRGKALPGGVFFYGGVPYAAAPVGSLRWRPPQPPASWEGVRDAAAFAADCVQIPSPTPRLDSGLSRAPGLSEDCLHLNVWTASDHADAKLPVLVWFHGGGFVRGSAAEPVYDGEQLAHKGLLVVTVNYRVGAFGFFAHPALTRESPHDASGNYGLLDTIAALRWIRDNIAQFGGDPNRVAIAGQSAGGAIVGNLIVSPLARGLFQRVIPQSPGSFRPLGELPAAEALGLQAGPDIEALRQLKPDAILALNAQYQPKSRGLTTPRLLRPIVDGYVLPAQETALYLSGKFSSVPMMVGTCEDEGSMLVAGVKIDTLVAYRDFFAQNFGTRLQEAFAQYPAQSDAEVLPAYERALGDTQFHYAARSLSRVSTRAQQNTYRYLFTHRMGGVTRAAMHCDELGYVFGNLEIGARILGANPPSEAERALAETLQDVWIRFIATGNPNGGAVKDWPRYDAATDPYLEFGDSIAVKHDFRRSQMDFLDRTYGLFQ